MVKALDIISNNKALQEHWIKRIAAFILDAIIVFLPLWIIFSVVLWVAIYSWGPWWGWTWWLFESLVFYLYFVVTETAVKASIGKKILNLQVVTTTGQPLGIGAVFMRNLSKIIPLLPILDVLIGFITEGDPRQKFSDRIANCTVTRTDAQAYIEEQFRQMQYVPPHPHVSPEAWGQPQQYQQSQSAQPTQQPPPGGWPQQSGGGWSPQMQSQPSQWPQHKWDEEGRLMQQPKFCSSCGGQLSPRGDGKSVCTRCGLVY